MRKRPCMKSARKSIDEFFAEPYIIVERIQEHLQSLTPEKVFQEDVGAELGIPPNVLSILKTRKAQSFLPFAFKWCLDNGLDISKFCER